MKLKFLAGSLALLATHHYSFSQQNTVSPPKEVDLKEVNVTASRMELPLKRIPQKVELIKKDAIEAIPGENIGEILKRTTNLDIIQYPGALVTVGMRGFPATAHSRSYVLILIDGKPAGTNNLATIPSDIIERIEVVKGPYSVMYGSDAMGGVINVVTKMPADKATGKIALSAGSYGQSNFSAYTSGAVLPKLRFSMGYARRAQNSDYRIGKSNLLNVSSLEEEILDRKSYGDAMTNTQYQINTLNTKLQYLIDDNWSVDYFSNITISNDIETPGNYWHSNGMSKKDIDRIANYLNIRYSKENNDLLISPYLSTQNEANYDNNTDSAFIKSNEKIKQYGLKVANTHNWGDLRWLAGADFDAFEVHSKKYSDKWVPTTPLRPNHTRTAASAFTQLAYTWNNLFVNAGLRYNYITYTLKADEMLKNEKKTAHYSNLNPSLGVNYRFTKDLYVHASAGNAFYVPDAYKTAGVYKIGKKLYVGNPDLKPEKSVSYDLGINYGYKDYFNIDLTYFQNFYDNKIVNDNSRKDTTSYKNATKGMMNGFEVLFSSNIASLWNAPYRLELFGGATYFLNARFDDEVKTKTGTMEKVRKDMLYIRKATANFGIGFDNNKGFSARMTARYIGHRLENDWNGNQRPDITSGDYYDHGGYQASDKILRHPSHLIFDLSSHYDINKHFRVGFSVTNLFDENYTEKDGYNMPGRSIMGHVSYQF